MFGSNTNSNNDNNNNNNNNNNNRQNNFSVQDKQSQESLLNYTKILGVTSSDWKFTVLTNLLEAPMVTTGVEVIDEELELDSNCKIIKIEESEVENSKVEDPDPARGLNPNSNSTSDSNSSSSSFTTSLIRGRLLFSFFVPSQNDQNKHSLESLNFTIWDATCHIMGELAGIEHHGIFAKETIAALAKNALDKAYVELGITDKNPSEQEARLAGGVAIWNLLLPQSAGGIYPNEFYSEFIKHLNEKLKIFWEGFENDITPVVLKLAFSDFKEFALNVFKEEMRMKKMGYF